MSTVREMIYNITIHGEEKDIQIDNFIQAVKDLLMRQHEVKIPMQLFEAICKFDYHRGVKHPISSSLVKRFREHNLKVLKVRNKYLVRIVSEE